MLIRTNYSGILINLGRVAVFSFIIPDFIKKNEDNVIDWDKVVHQGEITVTFNYTYFVGAGTNSHSQTIYINPARTALYNTWVLEQDSVTKKEYYYYYYYDKKGNRSKQFPFKLYNYIS